MSRTEKFLKVRNLNIENLFNPNNRTSPRMLRGGIVLCQSNDLSYFNDHFTMIDSVNGAATTKDWDVNRQCTWISPRT